MKYLYGRTIVESGHPLDSALFKPCPEEKPTEKPTEKAPVKKKTRPAGKRK